MTSVFRPRWFLHVLYFVCRESVNSSVLIVSRWPVFILASFPGFIAFRRSKAWDPFTRDRRQMMSNWTESTTAPTHLDTLPTIIHQAAIVNRETTLASCCSSCRLGPVQCHLTSITCERIPGFTPPECDKAWERDYIYTGHASSYRHCGLCVESQCFSSHCVTGDQCLPAALVLVFCV